MKRGSQSIPLDPVFSSSMTAVLITTPKFWPEQSLPPWTMDEGDGDGGGGTPLYSTNDLWLELVSTSILSPTNLSASLTVHAPPIEADGIFDLFFKTNLLPGNTWYWVARGLPGQTNFYLVNLSLDGGFFILGTTNGTDTNGLTAAYRGLIGGTETLTNDFDQDGLSDAWEINNFGDLSQPPFADYDGDGVSNYGSYTNLNDGEPNQIQFFLNLPAERVNSNVVSASLNIRGGNPSYYSVLVNNTNRAGASWQLFNSTNLPVSLSSGDGQYSIQIGLRGRAIGAQETWLGAELILDTVPPAVAITNPTSSITSWPLIQLQGWANEPLGSISFDITNSSRLTTNLTGYVTSQFADTNLLQFTTNYFQCYDLPLAEGTNRVTLRVTDLAGNTTTTNLTVRLDYSIEISSPGLSILWPANGTQIAADTFTVQATVDNPTATVQGSIVDNAGNTNTVQGIIERNGFVWVKNLPLAAGTNALILTATSAAGHTTTSSVTLIRSSVTVSLDPLSTSQLNQSSISLTGSVSSSSVGVWVNGIHASVDGSGNWEADNILTSPNGTALFDIEVYNPGSGPPSGTPIGSLEVDQPQPARVVLMSYSGTRQEEATFLQPCHNLAISETDLFGDDIAWSYDQGGFYRQWYGGNRENPPYDITSPLSPGEGSIAPPWEFDSTSVAVARAVDDGCFQTSVAEHRRTETRVMIEPEGQESIGESRLYLVRAKALQFAVPDATDNFYAHGDLMSGSYSSYAGTIPISPETLQINGVTLANTGETNADGSTWGATLVQAPAGVRPELKLAATQVQGYNDRTFDVKAEPVKLSITANGVTLESDRVVSNAEFCVGQRITFSTNWSRVPTGIQSRTPHWTLAGNYVNDYTQASSSASTNYFVNINLLTNETTSAWWVSGANPPATYEVKFGEGLTFTNGKQLVVTAKGQFKMFRPTVAMVNPAAHGTPSNIWLTTWNSVNFGKIGLGIAGTTNNMSYLARIISADFSGDAKITQICTIDATALIDIAVTNQLDNSDPYVNSTVHVSQNPNPTGNINVIQLDDAPQDGWVSSFHMNASFIDYFMFVPTNAGSIYVPLGKLTWDTSFGATYPSTNISPNSVSGPTNPDNSEDWPVWTATFSNSN